ncbi:hypothetical protein ABC628_09600 [Lentilactobacillus otakiensis]|uniref:hypothetical protein n=1 Tax=Lentilactobacillus otakiensis TaxID=481720 RepID=UPI0031D79491
MSKEEAEKNAEIAGKIYQILKKEGVSYTRTLTIFTKMEKEIERHIKNLPLT